ncbi:MAG: GntR family transcriptional regulator [Microbacteriaceae bacterium]
MTQRNREAKERVRFSGGIQDQVHRAIRDMITSGELRSGETISEISLAERFGVSRTPVREALKQLKAEGLIEIRAQVGTFVANPTLAQVEEMSVVRGALESLACGLMASRNIAEDTAQLRANIHESEVAVAEGDTETYGRCVAQFHRLILEGSGNQALMKHYQLLVNQLSYPNLIRASLGRPGRTHASLEEHRAIVEAIASGDRGRADAAMRLHVEHSHAETMQALAMSVLDSQAATLGPSTLGTDAPSTNQGSK